MDKKLIQLEYEVLGIGVQAIAKTHNISQSILNYTIKEQGWKRLPIADKLSTWKHDANPTEDLLAQVQEQARLINTLRESELAPQILIVEQALLTKTNQMISAAEEPSDLRMLAEVVKIIKPDVKITEGQDEGLKIMVVNQFKHPSESGDQQIMRPESTEVIKAPLNGEGCSTANTVTIDI